MMSQTPIFVVFPVWELEKEEGEREREREQ